MNIRNPIFFLFQTITVALAALIVVLLLKPEVLERAPRVVEFKQSPPLDRQAPRPPGPGASGPFSYAAAVENAAPSVVNVYTTKVVTQRLSPLFEDPFFQRFFGEEFLSVPRDRLETSLGSGVLMSEDGYILTNVHVITDADAVQVQLRDGRTAEATVIGADPDTDLAVLKIGITDCPGITLGRSDELRVGDVALAIGNPFGVGQTVTMGIVSATGRSQLGLNTFENFIQTDAAINPGNSGGALINPLGHLVGINTAIFSQSGGSQGIGFAIPVNLAKSVMEQIIEHGRVVRGWLGVEAQDVNAELAESFGLEQVQGVIVAGILRQGPADLAGLKPGDIILRIGDEPVDDSQELLNLIAQSAPNSEISLEIMREGRNQTLMAIISERPATGRR